MSDTTITSESQDSGTAVTETPAQPTGSGDAVPQNTEVEGGGEQSQAEGGQTETGQGRKRWSIQDEVKELRAQRRELRERLGGFDEVRNELASLRDQLNRQSQSKDAKTPASFWQDPEGTLDAKLTEKLERLQEQMFQRFDTTREQEYAHQALRQEQASATEFIRTQKGYDPQDDEDLIEIIEAIPKRTRESSSPQMIAEYAWMKLQASRGVGDRTIAKQRASGVQGQPPGQGFGRKVWSKAEFDAAIDQIEKSPQNPKFTELIAELESAHKEGRVK